MPMPDARDLCDFVIEDLLRLRGGLYVLSRLVSNAQPISGPMRHEPELVAHIQHMTRVARRAFGYTMLAHEVGSLEAQAEVTAAAAQLVNLEDMITDDEYSIVASNEIMSNIIDGAADCVDRALILMNAKPNGMDTLTARLMLDRDFALNLDSRPSDPRVPSPVREAVSEGCPA